MAQDKIIDRIRKLLSLATSSNEHEAAAAAAQAARLMMEHGIEEAQLEGAEGKTEAVEATIIDENGRLQKWRGVLLVGLTEAFDCVGYSAGEDGQRAYKVAGQKSKTATIVYMYSYLCHEIDRLANKAYAEEVHECELSGVERPGARSWKNAFRVGAAGIIQQRLIAERKTVRSEAQAAGKSLMRIDQDALAVKSFVKQNLKLRTTSGPHMSSRSGYEAGKAAGSHVSLGGGKGLTAGARRLGS